VIKSQKELDDLKTKTKYTSMYDVGDKAKWGLDVAREVMGKSEENKVHKDLLEILSEGSLDMDTV